MIEIRCSTCGFPYPPKDMPHRCPKCGGIFDYFDVFNFNPEETEPQKPGLWRYQHAFGLADDAPVVSLGEGRTPLIWNEIAGKKVGFKLEYQNPTGSYKDRGSAVLASELLRRGVNEAVEDSSGNAGASFAAYAARAGIKARIFVPESASGPKRIQIERVGAELVRIPGPRSAAAEAVLSEVMKGTVYASHAYAPFGLAGIATIAYEIYEDLGYAPGSVIAPVGHGGLLLGIIMGFRALENAGCISRSPYYLGVQAAACAPMTALFKTGTDKDVTEGTTIAEGVKVRNPSRAGAIIKSFSTGNGEMLSIAEEKILPAADDLAQRGFYVEPTSALGWAAFLGEPKKLVDPVIVILSGSGYKYQKS